MSAPFKRSVRSNGKQNSRLAVKEKHAQEALEHPPSTPKENYFWGVVLPSPGTTEFTTASNVKYRRRNESLLFPEKQLRGEEYSRLCYLLARNAGIIRRELK
ncbi:hypothetical protein CDAR_480411 [Caerostris darwini]|uniref:Uncharacterized protein n=1 Tax=Caerostris darwini TaxID=1538125 RepID=A0AAV4V1F7_9ARAC|nr:hypothetical protein CDAR_480411 [Caerostris darwini]